MAQMETGVRPPFMFNIGGPLTLAGPIPDPPAGQKSPYFDATNSSNFDIIGSDANSCSQGTAAVKPAIGVYDNGSQDAVIGGLPGNRYPNYQGAGGTPSVEDVYAALGGDSLTPSALDGFIKNVQGSVTTPVIPGPATSLPSTTTSSVTYVNGDLTLSGNNTGNGILVVTGTLTLKGNFSWNGLVLVIGQGNLQQNGGGNGNINGAMYVAQIYDTKGNLLSATVPGTPTFSWTGGGTNTIHYDHCLADNLLQNYENKPSSKPLQVLSTRMLNF
jgi:hypothetical protein